MRLKLDLDSENFDIFFQHLVAKLTPEQKELLPKELVFKLFQGGANRSSVSTSKLSYLEKIYILWKCFNARCSTIVEVDNGFGIDEYLEERQRYKKLKPIDPNTYENGNLFIPSAFIQGNKELCDEIGYLNRRFNSPAYTYAVGIKNRKPTPLKEYKKRMNYIARLFLNYDSMKGVSKMNFGITFGEIYILLYLYDEQERHATPLYKEILKCVDGASMRQLKSDFVSARRKGFITKERYGKFEKFKITTLGTDTLNNFFNKYVLNI